MPPDSLRSILDSVFAAPDYRWVERPRPYAFLSQWVGRVQDWLRDLQQSHPLGYRVLLAGLVVVFIAILVHAGWVLVTTLRRGATLSGGPAAAVPPPRDQAWYRREADRLAGAGRYAEAIQTDFLALVLALDRAGRVRFQPGKTPAEYGAELRGTPSAAAEFRELVSALYGFAFARRYCGAEEFAQWRARAEVERYAAA